MKADCKACSPAAGDMLCSVHRRAYSMQDLLREIADAYMERATAVLAHHQEPDPGRLPKAMGKVTALLAIVQAEQHK